jgi:hypothetical protein
MIQIQQQICVAEPEQALYMCWYEDDHRIFEVKPDWDLIEQISEAGEEFMRMLVEKEPPKLIERDFSFVIDERGSELLEEYFSLGEVEKNAKSRKDQIKKEIIAIHPERNFILSGSKVFSTSNSSYDTKAMKADGIDIEKYKKRSAPYWMISSPGRSKGN